MTELGDDDPLALLKAMKAEHDDPLDRLKALRPAPVGHQGKPFVDAPEIAAAVGPHGKPVTQDVAPGYAEQALGGLASYGRGTPIEIAQAFLRAKVHGQSYTDARNDIRGAEDTAPAAVRVGNSLVGGGLQAMALPGSAVAQGAGYGALSGALDSDPSMSLTERAARTALGGVVGAGIGRVGDAGAALTRAKAAPVSSAMSRAVQWAKTKLPTAATRAAASDATASPTLANLLAKAREISPNEAGNTPDYANEYAGSRPPEEDNGMLEALLRQSIRAKGGTPIPPAPRPVLTLSPAERSAMDGMMQGDLSALARSDATAQQGNVLSRLARAKTITPSSAKPWTGFGVPGNTVRALAQADQAAPMLSQIDAQLGNAVPLAPTALQRIAGSRSRTMQDALRSLGISMLTQPLTR